MHDNESWTPSPSLFKGGGRGWASPRSSHIAYTQGRTLSMADSHNFFAVGHFFDFAGLTHLILKTIFWTSSDIFWWWYFMITFEKKNYQTISRMMEAVLIRSRMMESTLAILQSWWQSSNSFKTDTNLKGKKFHVFLHWGILSFHFILYLIRYQGTGRFSVRCQVFTLLMEKILNH